MSENPFDQFDGGNPFDQFHQDSPFQISLDQAREIQPDIKVSTMRRPELTHVQGGLTENRVPFTESLNMDARAFADHATFGQANKIAAFLPPLDGSFSQWANKSYDQSLLEQQAASDELKEKNPGTYHTMGGIGLMASPVTRGIGALAGRYLPVVDGAGKAAPFLQRYGNFAAQGAGINALYQPTLGEHPEAGKESAGAAGLALGAGATSNASSGGLNWASNPLRMAPDGGAGSFAGSTAKNLAIGAATGVVPPAVLEGAGPVMKTILAPILSRLNPEEAAIAKLGQSISRQGWTPGMYDAKVKALGPAGMPANVGGQVTDLARDTAAFPGAARAQAQSSFNQQTGGKLSTRGGAVGRAESAINHNLTDETARESVDQLVTLRTRSSGPNWQRMFEQPRVPSSEQLSILAENPDVQKGIRQGLAAVRNDANAQGIRTDEANYFVDGQPTFQAWHAGKEGLDDILFSGSENVVNPQTGQLTKYGRSIRNLRASVLEELQLQFPEYREALDTWAGPTAAMRAIELGQRAARGDARVTTELLGDMTANERDFARIGFADEAKALVSKTRRGGDVSAPFFSNQNAARNTEAFFPDRPSFNQFRAAMAVEQKMHSSKNVVLGGSQTAVRQAGMEDVGQEIGEAAVKGAATHGAPGAALSLLEKGWKYMKAPPEAVRDAAGNILFSNDPARHAQVMEQLTRNYNKGSIFAAPGMSLLPGVGTVESARWGLLGK